MTVTYADGSHIGFTYGAMKNINRSLFGMVFCTVMACYASPSTGIGTTVTSQGESSIEKVFGKIKISVKIKTREIDIGKPSDERPQKIQSSCTYSRFPCSVIDYMEFSVNGNPLFVPRSVYADLADVTVASLTQKKKGQFLLTLNGGDASESYTVEIVFDENFIRQRSLLSNEAGQVMQRTNYTPPRSMNE